MNNDINNTNINLIMVSIFFLKKNIYIIIKYISFRHHLYMFTIISYYIIHKLLNYHYLIIIINSLIIMDYMYYYSILVYLMMYI